MDPESRCWGPLWATGNNLYCCSMFIHIVNIWIFVNTFTFYKKHCTKRHFLNTLDHSWEQPFWQCRTLHPNIKLYHQRTIWKWKDQNISYHRKASICKLRPTKNDDWSTDTFQVLHIQDTFGIWITTVYIFVAIYCLSEVVSRSNFINNWKHGARCHWACQSAPVQLQWLWRASVWPM